MCTPYYCHLVDSVIIYGGEIGDNDHDDDDGGVMLAILVSQKCDRLECDHRNVHFIWKKIMLHVWVITSELNSWPVHHLYYLSKLQP